MALAKLKQSLKIPPITPLQLDSTRLDSYKLSQMNPTPLPVLLKLNNGNYYYGKICKGEAADAKAIFIYKDDTVYEGEMVNGKFEGKGTLTLEGHFKYQGEWKDGRPDGQGTQVITNSTKYTGQFRAGKKNCRGKLQYSDGSVYEGDFSDNHIHGEGVYQTKAHMWEGNWEQGCLQGEGYQVSYGPDETGNSEYEGGFKKGVKHGYGTYEWGESTASYRGHFTEGQLDGEGYFKIGYTEYSGEWKRGVEKNLQAINRIVLKKKGQ